jgi:hypothetical protein
MFITCILPLFDAYIHGSTSPLVTHRLPAVNLFCYVNFSYVRISWVMKNYKDFSVEERNTAVDQHSMGIMNRPVARVLNCHKEQLLILRMYRRCIRRASRTSSCFKIKTVRSFETSGTRNASIQCRNLENLKIWKKITTVAIEVESDFKVIPLAVWRGPLGCRSLRLPDFQ